MVGVTTVFGDHVLRNGTVRIFVEVLVLLLEHVWR